MGRPRVIDARFVRATGIARYARNLVREIAALDPAREYAVIVPGGATLGNAAPNVREIQSRIRTYSVRELVGLPVALARLRPALVHATHYPAPALRRYPLVVTIHDLAHLRLPRYFPGPRRRAYAHVMLRIAARADAVVAPSESTKRDLVELLGVDPRRVTVVAEGVDPAIAPVARDAALAFARGIGIPGEYLLFVGEPKPQKGIDVLLAAFARLAPRVPVLLVLAGPRPDPMVMAEAARLGIADRVHAVGPVADADLAYLYAGASALVHPSRYEGFGLTLLEAMACGTPVVASDAGALPEVAGDAAVLVPAGEAEALADAVDRVLASDTLRRSLVERGHARAATYGWRAAAAATLAIYERIERR